MSMLDEMKYDCVMMDYHTADEIYGGFRRVLVEGAHFKANIEKNTTTQAIIAEKQGISETFVVVVDKGIPLQYNDIFKRLEDGQMFQVTSNIKDSEAPDMSTVKIGKVFAVKWEQPEDA